MLVSTPPAPIIDTPTTLFTAGTAKQHETRKHPEKAANAAISRPWPQDQLLLFFSFIFFGWVCGYIVYHPSVFVSFCIVNYQQKPLWWLTTMIQKYTRWWRFLHAMRQCSYNIEYRTHHQASTLHLDLNPSLSLTFGPASEHGCIRSFTMFSTFLQCASYQNALFLPTLDWGLRRETGSLVPCEVWWIWLQRWG